MSKSSDDHHDCEGHCGSHDQLPSVEEVKVDTPRTRTRSRAVIVTTAILVMVALLLGLLLVVLMPTSKASPSSSETSGPAATTGIENERADIFPPRSVGSRLRAILAQEGEISLLDDPKNYRFKAFERLARQENTYAMYSDSRLKQVYGLLALYYATNDNGKGWSTAIYWERDYDECRWEGIVCSDVYDEPLVVEIDLTDFGLNGAVPNELTLVESVQRIRLDHNPGLQGDIPAMFGRMNNLGKCHRAFRGVFQSLCVETHMVFVSCIFFHSITSPQ